MKKSSFSINLSLALLSLLALVAMPIEASATSVVYGDPIIINHPTLESYSGFGSPVSIDGDRFIISAMYENTGAVDAGSVYLYETKTGNLLQKFNNPTPAQNDFFGVSVSIFDDRVLIGAMNDDTGGTDAGSAYLFDAITGALLHTFNNPAPDYDGDHFGRSVSLSGNKVLIGVWGDVTREYDRSGVVYVYDSSTGELLHTINNPSPANYDYFGYDISVSGNLAIIGANGDDVDGNLYSGSAYLFDMTTGQLVHTFNNPAPPTSHFGREVGISGDYIIIGSNNSINNLSIEGSGSVYLYNTNGTLLRVIDNPEPAIYDLFGESISISGDKILIGARHDDEGAVGSGSVYLYDTNGSLLHTFRNPTPANDDYFGYDVSISGADILISAPIDDSVYLYLPQPDTDDDGVIDSADNCPTVSNTNQLDTDADGIGNVCDSTPNGDTDGDGIDNLADNCPTIANAGQADTDNDGIGNACDSTPNGDTDSDGVDNLVDNCPAVANSGQEDNDADGIGNACDLTPNGDTDADGVDDLADNCPADANANQTDTDNDGQGDLCDFTPNGDTDGDGLDNLADNCPGVANAGQEDNDTDGIGNVCDPTPNGDPDPNPTSINQCQQLDWRDFGFRNQGQCVAFVNTGHDSR